MALVTQVKRNAWRIIAGDHGSVQRNSVHARRIQLLKVKKNSSHSDFLQKLEKTMEVCEWEKMTKDQFLIHIFAESAD